MNKLIAIAGLTGMVCLSACGNTPTKSETPESNQQTVESEAKVLHRCGMNLYNQNDTSIEIFGAGDDQTFEKVVLTVTFSGLNKTIPDEDMEKIKEVFMRDTRANDESQIETRQENSKLYLTRTITDSNDLSNCFSKISDMTPKGIMDGLMTTKNITACDGVTANVPKDEPSESSNSSDGISPEFKEAMDSYESFMNDYVDFMKKYKENADPIAMMEDYNAYMQKYIEVESDF